MTTCDHVSRKMPSPLADGSFGLDDVRVSLANKMFARRKQAGLTQAQFARRAGQEHVLQIDEADLLASSWKAEVCLGGAPSTTAVRNFKA